MSKVSLIRPLSGQTANGWPESSSKPLRCKTSFHTACVPGSPNSRVLLGGATRDSFGVRMRKNASELPVSRDYWSPALCAALGASPPGGPPSSASSGAVNPSLPYGWSLLSRPGQRRGRACCQRERGGGTDGEGRRGVGHEADGPRSRMEPAAQL